MKKCRKTAGYRGRGLTHTVYPTYAIPHLCSIYVYIYDLHFFTAGSLRICNRFSNYIKTVTDFRIEFACFGFHVGLLFVNFSSFKQAPKITRSLMLYQANAATLTPFSNEGTILILKNLYECKGYNARQFITEFPDNGWTKNSINGEVKKLRNSRHVNKAV